MTRTALLAAACVILAGCGGSQGESPQKTVPKAERAACVAAGLAWTYANSDVGDVDEIRAGLDTVPDGASIAPLVDDARAALDDPDAVAALNASWSAFAESGRECQPAP